jgi:hypothetical protein
VWFVSKSVFFCSNKTELENMTSVLKFHYSKCLANKNAFSFKCTRSLAQKDEPKKFLALRKREGKINV